MTDEPPVDDHAISYKLLAAGTPVFSSDGHAIGTVDRVLENQREHIFDGIVLRTVQGERFLDAPDIGRITRSRVTAGLDLAATAALPAYEPGPPEFEANASTGRFSRFFGRGWKRRR
jgi:hypothetical protein